MRKSKIDRNHKSLRLVCVTFIVALLTVGCGGKRGAEPAQSEQPKAAEQGLEIANPASVNCIDRGGKLEMMEDKGGQFGVCVFNDGSRCEEWRLFRKECAPGTCREPSGICDK